MLASRLGLHRFATRAALAPARPFGTTARRHDFHFDTHHFVQRLEREGLNRAQAEGIMSAMAEVIDESVRNMTGNMVTKAEQEKVRRPPFLPSVLVLTRPPVRAQAQYTQQVDVAQLKSELQLLEKNDVALLKADADRLAHDLEKLRQRLREEIARTQAGVRLDLNLEKGRMREDVAGQELKITEVDTRIEQEIANLRTAIQASKVRAHRARAPVAMAPELTNERRRRRCSISSDSVSASRRLTSTRADLGVQSPVARPCSWPTFASAYNTPNYTGQTVPSLIDLSIPNIQHFKTECA
jgi:hypothetical protein